ncbi:MAG: DsbA family protein [Chitinophagaceae bacterium]|nr:DsbA family protein [Chitinophagaceae bacterium]
MKWMLYYCYDAYCGWCYGFSPVMNKLSIEYGDVFEIEVLSGGMIPSENPSPISSTAGYIKKTYKTVEELTGVKFGEDYLWHIFNPAKSDWYPGSEKPAIAMCVFKEYFPDLQVQFARDLQYALHYEGRDLCDDEAYRHLSDKYELPVKEFYSKLKSEEYKEKARYEFSLVKQLQVTGFPTVLLQANESKFYLLARGYTDYETLQENIEKCLKEINISTGH